MEHPEIDHAVVKKIIDGQPEDFRIIIERYRKLVSHITYRLVNNETDREELGQEIFIKIYQNLSSFRFESNLATWITKIAYHACLNYLRKKKIPLYEDQITNHSDEEEESGIEKVSSQNGLQDEIMAEAEMKNFLHEGIHSLPVQYKKIITFYHLDHMSYQEIAETMDLPEGTVKSYMFRARKILKERLLTKYQLEEICP